MSTDLTLVPFDQVIEGEDVEIACECHWHEERRGPAEWIVRSKEWCCYPASTKFWCNDCLQEVMQFDGEVHCHKCKEWHPGFRPKDSITSIEPLRPEAA